MCNAGEELHGILAKDLQIALRPAHPLPPGLGKARGLLVVEHRARRVADLVPAHDVVDGKLNVLGQQEEVPAAALVQHRVRKEKARSGDGAAAAKAHPRVVEILRLAQKPQRIACGDPVVAVVFGVSVAGHDLVAARIDLLDFRDEVRVEHIVRVQHKIGVVMLVAWALDAAQKLIEHIALAHLLGVETLKNSRAVRAGNACRVVRAIVRTHENVHSVHRVALCTDAVEQLADDVFLIARRDEYGDAVILIAAREFLSPQQRHRHIIKLIGIADEKERHDDGVDRFYSTHSMISSAAAAQGARRRFSLWKLSMLYHAFFAIL